MGSISGVLDPFRELLRWKKGDGEGGGAVSSRSLDLMNSMIYDLKRSVDLR